MNNIPPTELPSTEKAIPEKKSKARNHSLFEVPFKKIASDHPKNVHITIFAKKMPSSELTEEGTKKKDMIKETYKRKTITSKDTL